MPTAVVVTVVGAALTAWLIPALTRQWQDQERARELKAAIVTRIGRDTAEALVVSSFIANGRFEPNRRTDRPFRVPMKLFNNLDLSWERNRREIEAQLEAYFPETEIVSEWRSYSELVRDTYWLITDRRYLRKSTVRRLREWISGKRCDIASLLEPFDEPKSDPEKNKELTGRCKGLRRSPRNNYSFVARELLGAKSMVTEEILRADPVGLSTDASDFFDDLLPFV
ncbi:MAG: hypothetical protein M3322_13290 [Actinomycetota bacterium]|nr:hypothetical protein [Actinomycetota bacterium]